MTGTSTKIGMHLEGYDNGDNTHWEVWKAMGKVERIQRIQEKGHVSMFRTQGTDMLRCHNFAVAMSLKAVGLVIAFVLGAFTCGLLFGLPCSFVFTRLVNWRLLEKSWHFFPETMR